MNIRAARWALDSAVESGLLLPAPCHVLLVLACHADADWRAWPSVSTMADETRLNRSTVMRSLSVLESVDLLEVERRNGALNLYHLPYETSRTERPVAQSDRSHEATKPVASEPETGRTVRPNGIDGIDGALEPTFLQGSGWIADRRNGEIASPVDPDTGRDLAQSARAALQHGRRTAR